MSPKHTHIHTPHPSPSNTGPSLLQLFCFRWEEAQRDGSHCMTDTPNRCVVQRSRMCLVFWTDRVRWFMVYLCRVTFIRGKRRKRWNSSRWYCRPLSCQDWLMNSLESSEWTPTFQLNLFILTHDGCWLSFRGLCVLSNKKGGGLWLFTRWVM